MEYLLVMSFSGSTMMGIYLLIKHLLKDKVSSRLYYLIIKESILFFLIPLPFLKEWYRKVIWPVIPKGQTKDVQILVKWTKYVVHVGEKTYVNSYGVIQTAVLVVWLFIVCILMVRLLLKYSRIRRLILKYEVTEMTEKQRSFLAEMKKQYGVRRPVILCQGRNGDHTMTFGVCRPVIICDKEIDSWEAEMHVRHEMVHIKRLDALWKMLTRLVVILHWWNPIAWMLRREFERICEYSCDEIVMQGRTREEVKEYLRLLIDEACAASEMATASMGWQNGFANDAEHIKERMKNLSIEKKWNRYVAWMLAAVLAFANSMTVFAYRDTFHQYVPENISQEEITGTLRMNDFSFTPDGTDWQEIKNFEPLYKPEILYEKQFTDSEENIYSCMDEEAVTTYESCSHDFVSGTLEEHTKKSDGSCEIEQYHAQRCDICGYVIKGEEINVSTYKVCPH